MTQAKPQPQDPADTDQERRSLPTVCIVFHRNDEEIKNEILNCVHELKLDSREICVVPEQSSTQDSPQVLKGDICLILLSEALLAWKQADPSNTIVSYLPDGLLDSITLVPAIYQSNLRFTEFTEVGIQEHQGIKINSTSREDAREEFRGLLLGSLLKITKARSNIFISYKHDERSVADNVLARLEKPAYFSFWIDHKILLPGGKWEDQIQDGIDECDYFFALLSRSYLQSIECFKELIKALEKKKRIIFLRCKSDFTEENITKGYRQIYQRSINIVAGVNKLSEAAIDAVAMNIIRESILGSKDTESYIHNDLRVAGKSNVQSVSKIGAKEIHSLFNLEEIQGWGNATELESSKHKAEDEVIEVFVKPFSELSMQPQTYAPLIPVIGGSISTDFYLKLEKAILEITKSCSDAFAEDFIGSPCLSCPLHVAKRTQSGLNLGGQGGKDCPVVKMFEKIVALYGYDTEVLKRHQDCLTAMGCIETAVDRFVPEKCEVDFVYKEIKKRLMSEESEDVKTRINEITGPPREQLKEFLMKILSTENPVLIDQTRCYAFPVVITTRCDNLVQEIMDEFLKDEYSIVYFNPPPVGNLMHYSIHENDNTIRNGCFKVFSSKSNVESAHEITNRSRNTENQLLTLGGGKDQGFPKRHILIQLFGRYDDRFIITRDQYNCLLRTTEDIVLASKHMRSSDKLNPLLLALNYSGEKKFVYVGHDTNDPTLPYALKSLKDLSTGPLGRSKERHLLLSYTEPSNRISNALNEHYSLTTLGVPNMAEFIARLLLKVDAYSCQRPKA
jgi:hypothetical protein